jgi:hypothetical protein
MNYIDPNNLNLNYPQTQNREDTKFNCREQNNRSLNNVNSFMNRSLDTVKFIEKNNNKNIWFNPIVNTTCPKFNIVNNNFENINLGINTRGNRKLNMNDNLHLNRSMMMPDFRQGNRFFEFKPENSRRETHRDIGNKNVMKFQNQTQQMFQNQDYAKAYDTAYGNTNTNGNLQSQ